MKRIRMIALLLFLGLLLGGCARTALETGSWGLSFPNEGESPVGNASSEELRQYDAAFMGNPEEKTLYLTFDLGYEGGYTAQILDTLKEKHVPAAFFVVGTYVEQNPELIRRMADEGHTVGNHTYHHWDMSKIGDEATFSSELQAVADAYQAATGQEMTKYYRPPQGIFSEENLKMAQKMGYRTVFWSLAYVDWLRDNQPTDAAAFDKLLPRTHNGAVILLHATSETNARILSSLIDRWTEQGYRFGTLDELFGAEGAAIAQ